MSNDASGLPQAAIDEMFRRSARRGILPERRPTSPPASGEQASSAAPSDWQPQDGSHATETPVPPASYRGLGSMHQSLEELSEQTGSLGVRLEELEQKLSEAADLGAAITRLEKRLGTALQQLMEMEARVSAISGKLRDTPSYGVRGEFTCESCGAQGSIAIPLKCTRCGKQGWWGWWPATE